jgi:hypothetical protein
MRWSEDRDGSLVVTHGSRPLERALPATGLVALAGAVVARVGVTPGSELATWLLLLAGFLVAGGLLCERSRFVFDPARRTVEWRRRFLLRERGGSVPFDAIEQVELQTPIGDDGVPSRRVCLRRKDGGELPLTIGYSVDADDAKLALAHRLRELLGVSAAPFEPAAGDSMVLDDVVQLARAGRKIEAIKRVRMASGVSLAEAKQRVEELAAREP